MVFGRSRVLPTAGYLLQVKNAVFGHGASICTTATTSTRQTPGTDSEIYGESVVPDDCGSPYRVRSGVPGIPWTIMLVIVKGD